MLIKPGLLILRILLELQTHGLDTKISLQEILTYLLPIKSNSEWVLAFQEIKKLRQRNISISVNNTHARRNVMAWMKLLSITDVFSLKGSDLHLSSYGFQIIETLKKFCDKEESFDNFWLSKKFDRFEKLEWFQHIGQIPFYSQALLDSDIIDQNYLLKNYVGGLEKDADEEEEIELFNKPIPSIKYSEVTQRTFNTEIKAFNVQEALKNLRSGAIRRQTKVLLHDQIVSRLAKKFESQGAKVSEDRNSVDLFVRWPDESKAIFEVKTATMRTLQPRMRLAVGQLLEYSYRIKNLDSIDVERVAVFNLDIPKDTWQVKFLNEYLDIGLICINETSLVGTHNSNSKTLKNWKQVQ